MSDDTPAPQAETCEHGLRWLHRGQEQECALDYLNRCVAPRRVASLRRRGGRLFLVFDTGEKLECCCESCGESHGDDCEYVQEIEEVAVGRRALRFRLENDSGNLVVWFARGDHLHLHRKALERFRPARRARRSVRPAHAAAPKETEEEKG